VRTFSVDFVGSEDAFRPDAFRTSRDAPFVREVVERIHSTHQNVVLGASEMYDPALRRSVIVARDAPNGQADSDMSLYLLFRAIRDKSTVALSGESADESFGGYKWFHDPGSRRLPVFPWVAQLMTPQGATSAISPFRPEIMNALKLEQYMLESYSTAVKSVEHLPGATAQERQMRTLFHMHLTRFLPMLLDRKDRMSMAVGLEVRVPYCDHRLVEYVYNAPWSMQSFDGREKSLLRHAAAGLLPHSVATRLKSGYPTIQDATYVSALQQQGKEALAVPGHPVFNLVNRAWVRTLVAMDPARVAQRERGILERIIDLSIWLDVYQPELALS
jgi:asparagine synthase (glutamine-hydrolysing)